MTTIIQAIRLRRTVVDVRHWLWLGIIAAAILAPVVARAITPLSQGYSTSDSLSIGSIVSLDENSTDHVSAAKSDNSDSIIGVVINAGNSLLTLSNGQENQIQVATSGVVDVLVSNVNGDIEQGDQVTASPLGGVGMKATSSAKVVGIAQGKLVEETSTRQSYKDGAGKEQTTLLGQVPVLVNVSYYYKQPDKSLVPSAIQNIANALAGKPVDSLPILISSGIFIVTIIVVVSIIYSMIRSSIISVGRNPMSQSAIYRDLVQMSALVVGILVVSVVSIYLVLTKL